MTPEMQNTEVGNTLPFSVVEKRGEAISGTLEIFKQVNKQKQEILNLDSGKEEEITVLQATFIVPDFDANIHGSLERYEAAKIAAAQSLVQPVSKQADALLKYAASDIYQESKRSALSAGNFMSQDLKSVLVTMLKARPAFKQPNAEGKIPTAKDVFERWMKGFTAGVPQTKKYLDDAKIVLSLQNGGEVEAVDEGF